jgi:hypothetical protein
VSAQVVSAIVASIATAFLGIIARMLSGMRRDVKQFMTEHLFLLAMADWTKTSVPAIMAHLGMPMEKPPPDLIARKRGNHD